MFDVFIMDMGGHDDNVQQILSKLPHAQTMRYMTSHLEMVKRAAAKSKTEFFWLIASCCNYVTFDFDYISPPWEQDQIHCWASGKQKFGDTFLINVKSWQAQQTVEKLEWYKFINFHRNGVERLEWPKVKFSYNLAEACKNNKFTSLYNIFHIEEYDENISYDVNLWEDRSIIAFNKTGFISLCPRDVVQQLKTQMYDYKFIQHVNINKHQNPQNIIFISYDEVNADDNWKNLKNNYPYAKRVHGVKGLTQALKTAAQRSTTEYFYAVFGKTEIVDSFKFNYNPDYLKSPCNYVFYSYNPILEYSYGHDGVVMYDRNWLLELDDWDLDITMTHSVTTVPIISCINRLDISPWSAWRTAFREAYKLSYYLDKRYTVEDDYHLHLWLTKDNTENGRFSKLGANQGREYYIKNSNKDYNVNDWSWLESLFNQTMTQHLKDYPV